jgi:hypothetical protein
VRSHPAEDHVTVFFKEPRMSENDVLLLIVYIAGLLPRVRYFVTATVYLGSKILFGRVLQELIVRTEEVGQTKVVEVELPYLDANNYILQVSVQNASDETKLGDALIAKFTRSWWFTDSVRTLAR